ncbi:hypothetical protein R6V09_09510 [Streptomyces sp. W16]|uniref:hypothetical protein n=1 Tax=Streptomyces sp. W16 TaxID=3076631 RepID=UPI00295BAB47|nr:hypothetical protein [Streptomyces sp. W16]MDV9170374.1 hypothetical protein [Streptomyces sp. W16]
MTTQCSTTTTPARFLLLGDSHAGCVGRAAQAADLPFVGGPVGSGRDFLGPFFDTDTDTDVGDLTFREAGTQRLYREFLDTLDVTALAGLRVPLVCTFGLSAHTVATRQNWDLYRDPHGTVPELFLRSGLFADLVRATARGALAFYDHAAALGLRVLAPLPPQRVPGMSDPDVFFAAQHILADELTARGAELVDLRGRVTDDTGLQRAAFCQPDDTIHGNLAFGRLVVSELLDRGL